MLRPFLVTGFQGATLPLAFLPFQSLVRPAFKLLLKQVQEPDHLLQQLRKKSSPDPAQWDDAANMVKEALFFLFDREIKLNLVIALIRYRTNPRKSSGSLDQRYPRHHSAQPRNQIADRPLLILRLLRYFHSLPRQPLRPPISGNPTCPPTPFSSPAPPPSYPPAPLLPAKPSPSPAAVPLAPSSPIQPRTAQDRIGQRGRTQALRR
jgi:hypothetical protein